MVKTGCPKPSFERYREILLEHHGRIHPRDSSNLAPPSKPLPAKGAGKNKGKGWYRPAYFAGDYDGHTGDEAAGEGDNYDWNEDYSEGAYVGGDGHEDEDELQQEAVFMINPGHHHQPLQQVDQAMRDEILGSLALASSDRERSPRRHGVHEREGGPREVRLQQNREAEVGRPTMHGSAA